MKSLLRRNAPLFYVLATMLALYIPWLNRGYLNWEWGSVLAGRGLASTSDAYLLQAYQDAGHANPLGYPFLISIIYRVFGNRDFFWLARIPAMIGSALIVVWGYSEIHRRNKESRVKFYVWSTLVILHPMIIAFSTSATTDIATVGLLMASFMFLSQTTRRFSYKLIVGSGLMFGLSSSVKYITPIFGFVVVFFILKVSSTYMERQMKKIIALLVFGLFAGFVLLVEIVWKWKNTGVLLSGRNAEMRPNFTDFPSLLMTLLKHVSFLGLFAGCLPLVIVAKNCTNRKQIAKRAVLLFAIMLVGWIQSKPLSRGEMDFGAGFPFGNHLNSALQTVGFVSGIALCNVIYGRFRSGDILRKALIVGLVPYLILISASRPAQRYLTYAIPIVLLILVEALEELPKKVKYFAVGSTAFGFAAVSLLGLSYLTAQGNASEDMAVWVEESNLISQTSAGAISPHAGQHFWGIKTTELRYEIIAVTPANEIQVRERVLHREPMKVLGKVTRVYLLRELPLTP